MWKKAAVACAAMGFLAAAHPARAQEGGLQVSLGYAFAAYLEEGGGNAPLGAYLSLCGRRSLSLEADLGWQQDSFDGIKLNTFTATAGPRFRLGSGDGVRPFVHVLGGLRHDRIEGNSNTSWGGLAGGGVDVPAGERMAIRLGADYQMFFDQGDNVKVLRLSAGITF
jgi:hypothetical protein